MTVDWKVCARFAGNIEQFALLEGSCGRNQVTLAWLLLVFSQIKFIAPMNDLGGQAEVDVVMIAVFCGQRYWSGFVLFMAKQSPVFGELTWPV